MAVTFIKKLKQVVGKPSIKKELHTRIPGIDKPRSLKNIHASSLTKADKEWCPREVALQGIVKKKASGEFIGTSLQTTFDQGKDIQRRINEDYLTDIMVGNWKCRSCGDSRELCKKPKGHCGKSGIKCNWEYIEIRPMSPYCGVSCGIDCLVDFGLGKLWLIECKIMNITDFEKIQAPLAEHRLRTRMYLELIEQSPESWTEHIHTEEAIVLYVARTYGKKDEQIKKWGLKDLPFSPYKEFYVTRRTEDVEDYLHKAAALHHYREYGGGMPYGVCKSHFDKRTQKCPVNKECWGGKYPAKVTWMENGKPRHEDAEVVDMSNVQLIAKSSD